MSIGTLTKKTGLTLLTLLFCWGLSLEAAAGDELAGGQYGAIINLSCKQRMLTQKLSKEFFLVAYGNDTAANKQSLLNTSQLFDRTLVGLLEGDAELGLARAQSPGIRSQLNKVKMMWSLLVSQAEYAAAETTTEITADRMELVAKGNLPLLKEMDKAVKMFEKQSMGVGGPS